MMMMNISIVFHVERGKSELYFLCEIEKMGMSEDDQTAVGICVCPEKCA